MFSSILTILKEALTMWRLKTEIQLKRLVLDEQDKIEKELEDLRTKHDAAFEKARKTGNTDDLRIADRLRERLQQRIQFSSFIPTGVLESQGGAIDSNPGRNLQAPNQ